jgi:oligogalacturonide lyase
LLFLREVQAGVLLSEIHEVNPDTGAEQRVAPTSQYAAFAPNGDASVFVGASRSKAQPNIVLLLRTVNREFTLCEHRASHPALVSPVFSPDSRRVYFQSDHQGKSALYSVNVELLVEPTQADVT